MDSPIKFCFPFCKIFVLIVTTVLCLSVQNGECWRPRHFPKIGIAEFAMEDEDDHHMWETDIDKMPAGVVTIVDNGETYLVSQPILALTIDCNATYPIQWSFANAEEASENVYSVRIRMLRQAKDVYNPLTNTFTSQLQLYGDTNAITGEYSCFSTEYTDIKKKIYIYWMGGSPTPLIMQGKTEDVCVKPNNKVILPCRVAEPDVKPSLYFEESCDKDYKLLDENPYIKFNSRVGYTIDISQYDGAFGRYKCAMSEDDAYPAVFNLRNQTCIPHVFNNTIERGAAIRYNKKEQKIVCCSNSRKAPTIQAVFCFDPVSCKIRQFRLFKSGNSGVAFKTGNTNCAYEKIYERDSGMIRCKGDGIDVMRPFYTDLQPGKNESFNLYFDWEDLHPEKLILLNVGSRKPIYDKQNITVSCEISYFYFAEGVKWAVRWKNGSLEFKNQDTGESDRVGTSFQTIKLHVHKNMTEVICYAPVWNSTEWVNKSYTLDVRESKSPRFNDPDDINQTISLNLNKTEEVVICKASGTPTPSLRWRKNNRTVVNENNYLLKRINSSLVMTIRRVSHETQGEYRCIAWNIAGRVERSVTIFVTDPGQPLSATGILFVLLLVIILFGGVGFLLWRMQIQRKIITHLTGIVFREVDDNTTNNKGNNTSPNSNNANNDTNENVAAAIQAAIIHPTILTSSSNGRVDSSSTNAQVVHELNRI